MYVRHISKSFSSKYNISIYCNLFCSNVRCSYNISSDDPKKGLSLTFEVINLENRCYDWIKMALCKLYC